MSQDYKPRQMYRQDRNSPGYRQHARQISAQIDAIHAEREGAQAKTDAEALVRMASMSPEQRAEFTRLAEACGWVLPTLEA